VTENLFRKSMRLNIKLREANKDDCIEIVKMIRELAIFEKLEHMCDTTEELLAASAFPTDGSTPLVYIILAEELQEEVHLPAGFALYFYNFSTFLGKPGKINRYH
jgi:hypothetical protein